MWFPLSFHYYSILLISMLISLNNSFKHSSLLEISPYRAHLLSEVIQNSQLSLYLNIILKTEIVIAPKWDARHSKPFKWSEWEMYNHKQYPQMLQGDTWVSVGVLIQNTSLLILAPPIINYTNFFKTHLVYILWT